MDSSKVQKLKLKLQKAKDSKQKLKRKLKMKLAKHHLKMEAKLKYQKELVQRLKKKDAVAVIDCNDEMVEDLCTTNHDIADEEIETPVRSNDILFFHSYAKPYDQQQQSTMYQCQFCEHKTSKKSNLTKHEAAHLPQVRDMKCPICEKLFLYDELRGHLRYFSTGRHHAKNEHAKYTPAEHKTILENLKEQKKLEWIYETSHFVLNNETFKINF